MIADLSGNHVDAPNDTAFWLYVQEHFESGKRVNFDAAGARMTIRVPCANVVAPTAMRQFAVYRDRILTQLEDLTHHE